MRFDKLTTKFQQALSDAQSIALGADNSAIEPQHLRLVEIWQLVYRSAFSSPFKFGQNLNGDDCEKINCCFLQISLTESALPASAQRKNSTPVDSEQGQHCLCCIISHAPLLTRQHARRNLLFRRYVTKGVYAESWAIQVLLDESGFQGNGRNWGGVNERICKRVGNELSTLLGF